MTLLLTNFTYKDFTYNDFTYKDFTYNDLTFNIKEWTLHICVLFTVISKVIYL